MIIIITKYGCAFRNSFTPLYMYSIVKDSSADLGVNFNIVQNRPTVRAVCTKISKNEIEGTPILKLAMVNR